MSQLKYERPESETESKRLLNYSNSDYQRVAIEQCPEYGKKYNYPFYFVHNPSSNKPRNIDNPDQNEIDSNYCIFRRDSNLDKFAGDFSETEYEKVKNKRNSYWKPPYSSNKPSFFVYELDINKNINEQEDYFEKPDNVDAGINKLKKHINDLSSVYHNFSITPSNRDYAKAFETEYSKIMKKKIL